MTSSILIGLVGDYDAAVPAHQAIPRALALAAAAIGRPIVAEWVPTPEIRDESRVAAFDGIWCVPASPYRSMEGALCAIRFAREKSRPFLGTCGGFQHAIVEYARTVLGWSDAEHAETAPEVIALTSHHELHRCPTLQNNIRFRLRFELLFAKGPSSNKTDHEQDLREPEL